MPLSISPELGRQITGMVQTGEYDSAEDVIKDALNALSERNSAYQAKVDALRAEIGVAIADMDRGEAIPGPLAMEHARAEFRDISGMGIKALHRGIQKGIDDLNSGRHSPNDEVFARLRARRGLTDG